MDVCLGCRERCSVHARACNICRHGRRVASRSPAIETFLLALHITHRVFIYLREGSVIWSRRPPPSFSSCRPGLSSLSGRSSRRLVFRTTITCLLSSLFPAEIFAAISPRRRHSLGLSLSLYLSSPERRWRYEEGKEKRDWKMSFLIPTRSLE